MEEKTAPRICANCKWSEEIDWFEGDYMACECHRYPPTCATDKAFAVYPKVKHESHCGEFAREEAPARLRVRGRSLPCERCRACGVGGDDMNNLEQALFVVGSGFGFAALVAITTLMVFGIIDVFRGGD